MVNRCVAQQWHREDSPLRGRDVRFGVGLLGRRRRISGQRRQPDPHRALGRTSWSISPRRNNRTFSNLLEGVTCASASECWAVGSYDTDPNHTSSQTLIEHWNGTSWSIVASPNNGMSVNLLHGVACASASECWAVGTYYASNFLTLVGEYRPQRREPQLQPRHRRRHQRRLQVPHPHPRLHRHPRAKHPWRLLQLQGPSGTNSIRFGRTSRTTTSLVKTIRSGIKVAHW